MGRLRQTVAAAIGSTGGQNSFEYLLTVGTIVVAFVAALFAFDQLIQIFLGHVCPAVDTANPLVAIGSCITS